MRIYLLLLAGTLLLPWVLCGSAKAPEIVLVDQVTSQANTSPVKTKINPKDGAEMILIPAGDFLMGFTEEQLNAILQANWAYQRSWFSDAMPQHKVYLDDYYIYKNDVTVGMYRRFCQETGRQMPSAPDFNKHWSKEHHPIVDVTQDDAQAYCEWAGVNLPTEAQWEKAARGTDGREFPWGNTFDGRRLQHSSEAHDARGTVPVGSFPLGASPYGVMDMAGNVCQWCADFYDEEYYQNAPLRNPTGAIRLDREEGTHVIEGTYVVRGGSWFNVNEFEFRTAYRNRDEANEMDDLHGFRCVSGQ